MPTNHQLAVTEDTKEDVKALKRRLGVVRGRDETQNTTVRWLLDHAPDPEDAHEAEGDGE